MTKSQAREIISEKKMTWGDIIDILVNARKSAPDDFWGKRSVVNKSFSKGTCFNFMWPGMKDYDRARLVDDSKLAFVGANILREFGDISGIKASRKSRALPSIQHQPPMEIS